MPPDRSAVQRPRALQDRAFDDRNMPRTGALQTYEPGQCVDLTVTLHLGAFLALLVLPIMLIRGTAVDSAAGALLLAAITAANRSHLGYRRANLR